LQILLITTQDGWWYDFGASEFLCTLPLLLEEIYQQKKRPQKSGNTLTDALRMSRFQNFAKKQTAWFLETALCAVLINQSDINQLPN